MTATGRRVLSFERKILLSLGIPLAILILLGIFAYRTTSTQSESAALVELAGTVMVTLSDLHIGMLEIDNGARGYVISGGGEFLLLFNSGSESSWKAFGELDAKIIDPNQRKRLQDLRPQMKDAIARAQQLIDVRQTKGFEAAVALLESGSGQTVSRQVYSILAEMDSAEHDLLQRRSSAAKNEVQWLHRILAAGVMLGFLTVALAVFAIHRDMADRRSSEFELRESQELMQDFLDNANDLIHSVGVDGSFLYVNRVWRETLGYSEEDIAHLTLRDIIHPDQRERAETIRQKVLAGTAIDDFESVFVTKAGTEIRVSGHINARRAGGKALATRSIFRNITERKRAEEELQRSNEVLRKSVSELEHRSREIARLSEMGDLLQSCQSVEEAYRIIARSVPQIILTQGGSLGIMSSSRNLVDIVSVWGEGFQGERVFVPDDCWALRRGRMNVVEDPSSALHCGHLGPIEPGGHLCVPLVAQGEALGLLTLRGSSGSQEDLLPITPARQRLIGTVADRIALAIANLKLREAMRQQSVRDSLTGLYNRRHMEESLERELRRAIRSGRALGILMLDLDHFKTFNDRFGHDAGDTLLREFGNMLTSSVRGGDIACRYGGEEFALILPEAGLEVTRQRGEHLREKTKHLSVQHRGISLGTITLSVGVASYPEHGTGSDVLLRAADSALYAAKMGGRDLVMVAPLLAQPPAPASQA